MENGETLNLTPDEIDDLIFFARTGDIAELSAFLAQLVSERAAAAATTTAADILLAARDEGRSTCLHMAAANGHLDTVKFLLSQFATSPTTATTAEPETKSKSESQSESETESAETKSVSKSNPKQAFLDAPNEYGNTGLHWAALSGHLDVVKVLVEAGASVALANDKNYVPLDLASFNEKFDVVDYFLKQSEQLESKNEKDGLSGAVGGMSVEVEDGEEEKEGQGQGESASS